MCARAQVSDQLEDRKVIWDQSEMNSWRENRVCVCMCALCGCGCAFVYVCAQGQMCTGADVHVHVYGHMYVYVYVQMYVHMYGHVYGRHPHPVSIRRLCTQASTHIVHNTC